MITDTPMVIAVITTAAVAEKATRGTKVRSGSWLSPHSLLLVCSLILDDDETSVGSVLLTFATGLNSRQSGDWTQWGGDELPRYPSQAAPTPTERFVCR